MKVAWTKGITDEGLRKEIRGSFKASIIMRNRLEKMLQQKIQSKDRSMMKEEEYDAANWAFKQADAQGYKRAMTEILSLLAEK